MYSSSERTCYDEYGRQHGMLLRADASVRLPEICLVRKLKLFTRTVWPRLATFRNISFFHHENKSV